MAVPEKRHCVYASPRLSVFTAVPRTAFDADTRGHARSAPRAGRLRAQRAVFRLGGRSGCFSSPVEGPNASTLGQYL